MDKKKEVEKLAKILYDFGVNKQPNIADYHRADYLINLGYGNVKQVVKEFAEKVKEKFWWFDNNTIYVDDEWLTISDLVDKRIDELIKELYGGED